MSKRYGPGPAEIDSAYPQVDDEPGRGGALPRRRDRDCPKMSQIVPPEKISAGPALQWGVAKCRKMSHPKKISDRWDSCNTTKALSCRRSVACMTGRPADELDCRNVPVRWSSDHGPS